MKKLIMILMITSMASAIFAEGSISGVSYFGYSMKHMNADDEDDKDRGFELNRVYLTYKKEISEKASFTFQADMQNKFDDNIMYINANSININKMKLNNVMIVNDNSLDPTIIFAKNK